jgi:hypothetical protein
MIEDDRIQNWRRQLKRMADDAEGRDLLRRELGVQFVDPKDAQRPTVAILVPSYGAAKPRMMEACERMVAFSRKTANVYQPWIFGHSLISWVRNELLAKTINAGRPFTHVLFMDDDIVPEKDALLRMLAQGKDIVGALCTKRTDPPIPNIRRFDAESGEFFQIFHWKDHGKLIPVDAVGTGMMLLSRKAIDQVAEFYLNCGYERHQGMFTYEAAREISAKRRAHYEQTHDAMWFQLLPALSGKGEYGEDISFCLKAKLAGLQVYVDTAVNPQHVGEYGYSLPDFLTYKRELMAEAQAKGQGKDADAQQSQEAE